MGFGHSRLFYSGFFSAYSFILGSTPEEIENNCNYVLSVARKLGAVIFLVWEDIKDVNPKMIMTLFAALVNIVKYGQQDEMIDFTKKTATDL